MLTITPIISVIKHGYLWVFSNNFSAVLPRVCLTLKDTKNLAKTLAPKIIVNAIAPGQTLTPMWGELKKEEEKEFASNHLINRFITPEEIAEGILFLIKNDAICGEILTIDGGMSLKTSD